MTSEWYTLQTLSGQEQKAVKSLDKRIPEEEMGEYIKNVLLPMEKVVEVRNGKKTVTQRKLYPGYIFIEMSLYDEEQRLLSEPWDFIRNTQGVIGFLGGEKPISTPAAEIEAIQAQIADAEESAKKERKADAKWLRAAHRFAHEAARPQECEACATTRLTLA